MINQETIEEVKKRLVATYDPIAIYIFGSYAWGKPDEDSDLDLMIVVDSLKKDRYATISDGYRALQGLRLYKDILLYTKKEFEESAVDKTTFINKIAVKGKKIYAKA